MDRPRAFWSNASRGTKFATWYGKVNETLSSKAHWVGKRTDGQVVGITCGWTRNGKEWADELPNMRCLMSTLNHVINFCWITSILSEYAKRLISLFVWPNSEVFKVKWAMVENRPYVVRHPGPHPVLLSLLSRALKSSTHTRPRKEWQTRMHVTFQILLVSYMPRKRETLLQANKPSPLPPHRVTVLVFERK